MEKSKTGNVLVGILDYLILAFIVFIILSIGSLVFNIFPNSYDIDICFLIFSPICIFFCIIIRTIIKLLQEIAAKNFNEDDIIN